MTPWLVLKHLRSSITTIWMKVCGPSTLIMCVGMLTMDNPLKEFLRKCHRGCSWIVATDIQWCGWVRQPALTGGNYSWRLTRQILSTNMENTIAGLPTYSFISQSSNWQGRSTTSLPTSCSISIIYPTTHTNLLRKRDAGFWALPCSPTCP